MWCQVRVLRRIVILTIIIPFQVRTTTWTIITPNPTSTAIIQRNDRLGSRTRYGEASTTMRSYRCRTNLDDGRNKRWPETFVTCPRVGDYVAAECGYRLKVVAVTHCVRSREFDGHQTPYVEVELNR